MANLKNKPPLNAALNSEAWSNAQTILTQFCRNGGQRPRFQSQPPEPLRLCVGFSGGLDSTVLLHWLSTQQAELDFQLSAIHVHHGLSPNADAWAEHASQIAQQLGTTCQIAHVSLTNLHGQGIEGGARKARYAVFAKQPCDAILLAHHQNDQSETLLINLLRGSGPAGLAAMPVSRPLNPQIDLLRPLLQLPHTELLQYAQLHKLKWIEDESNSNTDFKRNKIRHELVPLLESINPKAISTIARSAIHQSDASTILLERAQDDLIHCSQHDALILAELEKLSPARQRNLLHYWLTTHGLNLELRAFDELLRVAFSAAADACPALVWRNTAIRRYRGALHITRASLIAGPEQNRQLNDAPHITDWFGTLEWVQDEHGIAEHFLTNGYRIAGRSGGESLKLARNRPTRSLKAQCQALGIAPWLRETTPLIYINQQFAAMPGLGVHADFQASADQMGWLPIWTPSPPTQGIDS
ncbi:MULTISPECIES: tRNA lysidine(34) synthetase TilS [Deefgea]|uniref:tRNA(Ile)-lysidine synthase n=1 Tax=Deefgea chitinilytica TaxID=570276 RepID=A0ABS2C9W7_9NEIS|nr:MULTISPECIES: tRNA lysidine(34) synthetase TilS [Deefgea]MBM5570943.1 tRNA lysidine(34) synthetase TilS [Deefgea chitinilytica]MBM9888173.1 tRNA lysidine(34) synthetase TilS [Deefgea sp. CFH1-16]